MVTSPSTSSSAPTSGERLTWQQCLEGCERQLAEVDQEFGQVMKKRRRLLAARRAIQQFIKEGRTFVIEEPHDHTEQSTN